MKNTVFGLFVILLSPVLVFAGDVVYVQSTKAKIMKEPSFKSAELGTAKKGDKLKLLEKGDGWFRVSAATVEGWVNGLCVSDSPPLNKQGIINDDTDIAGSSRRRASAVASAAASRGLTDAERRRLSDLGEMDYKSVMHVEKLSYSITEKELDNFTPPETRR